MHKFVAKKNPAFGGIAARFVLITSTKTNKVNNNLTPVHRPHTKVEL